MFSSYGRSLISGDICGSHADAQLLASPAVEHLQLEIAREHDFGAAVAVEVVNLKRRVVGEEIVLRIRSALLPQDLTLERDGGQAADLIEGVAAYLRDLLREQHVEPAVAVEIAESHVASGAVALGLELPPQLRPRIAGAQLFELALAGVDALCAARPPLARPRSHGSL